METSNKTKAALRVIGEKTGSAALAETIVLTLQAVGVIAGSVPSVYVLPETSAPQDGRLVWILVDYANGNHPLEDARFAWTIGHNTLRDTGEDEWLFAGWSWQQDCFTEGHGTVVGWCDAPIPPSPPDDFAAEQIGRAA